MPLPEPPPISNALLLDAKIHSALEELKKRGVKSEVCIRCHTDNWLVDILEIPVNSLIKRENARSGYIPTGNLLPTLAMVCNNCGFTMFHNLQILGISTR